MSQRTRKKSNEFTIFSDNESKRVGEQWFIIWSCIWISVFAVVVITKVYEGWRDTEYMAIGLFVSVPCVFVPIIFPRGADTSLPWHKRYATKFSVWVAVLTFIGNYFWTHYFFNVLGASYTLPVTLKLNEIPICLYLITQAYFSTYFVFSNILARIVDRTFTNKLTKQVAMIVQVLALSWFYAVAETVTIESYPYYSFVDRAQMYKVGVTFYALYFIPSFPIFYKIDEKKGECWDIKDTLAYAMAATLASFVLCDFWRLMVGNISGAHKGDNSLPFTGSTVL